MTSTDYIKSLYRLAGYTPSRREFMRLKSSKKPLLVTVWVHKITGQQRIFNGENFMPPGLFEEVPRYEVSRM